MVSWGIREGGEDVGRKREGDGPPMDSVKSRKRERLIKTKNGRKDWAGNKQHTEQVKGNKEKNKKSEVRKRGSIKDFQPESRAC